ncbi:MAG: hypothetical protein PHW04_04705 [Candidatus Wallbacteria bacterium]|nr:hypothetical protein [Candidatus Wallbacteria bacterium]
MENYLPFTWDWVRVVFVYSLTIFAVSSAILIPSLKLFNLPRLTRLPSWFRWVMVLPAAFIMGLFSEFIPRLIFTIIEVVINHQLTFKPGFDYLTWQAYAPIFFIIGGLKIAPSHSSRVFAALGGLKITMAIINIYTIIKFINGGGEWDRLDPVCNSPLWWNAPVCMLCIFLLIVFGVCFAAKSLGSVNQGGTKKFGG